MSYRITYPQIKSLRHIKRRRSWLVSLTGLFFLLLLVLTYQFWPEGKLFLQKFLIPGNSDVTVAAMETFSQELKTGASLTESFASFCRIVLEGARFDSY